MASHPPSHCCTVGVLHTGTPTGRELTIGPDAIPAYIAEPASPRGGAGGKKAILLITDVIGHRFTNAQLLADQFAANGYLVLMPDLFFGDAIPLNRPAGFDVQKWLHGPPGHLPDVTDPVVEAAVKALRDDYGVERLGAVGYCFGGKYVARFMAGRGVDVGYTAHPSFVTVEELKGVKGPLSIAAAETDHIFPAEKRHETEDVLKTLDVPYQVNLYSGVEHGFAVRADVSDKAKKFAKEAAFEQAVTWFHEWL